MAIVEELIRVEDSGNLSFGNYELNTKHKLDDFVCDGDLYKVKTYKSMTKLERNGMFLYESVPGTTVHDLSVDAKGLSFVVEGSEDAQITIGLEDDTDYLVYIDDVNVGKMKTNLGGKLILSIELENREETKIKVVK